MKQKINSLGMNAKLIFARRWVQRQTHWLTLAIVSVFGLSLMFIVPPLWGFDETSHFVRVYQTSQGVFISDKSKENFGGSMPQNYNEVSRYATADIGEAKDPNTFTRQDVNDNEEYKALLARPFSQTQEQAINPAGYSPLTYPLSEVLVLLARLLDLNMNTTLLLARLGNLTIYAVLAYGAVRILSGLKSRWLFFAIAISPVMLMQAATLSADSAVNGLSLVFMSILVLACVQPERMKRRHYITLALCTIWMPLVKINYVFLSAAIILIPSQLFTSRIKEFLYKFVTLCIGGLLGVIWTILISVTTTSGTSPRSDGLAINPSEQINYLLGHPFNFAFSIAKSFIHHGDTYIRELFGVMGWNYVMTPLALVGMTIVAVVVAAMYAREELVRVSSRVICSVIVLCALGIATIFAALYVGFTPVAQGVVDGVQGRYILPFLAPLLIVWVILVPVEVSSKSKSTIPVLVILLSVFASACSIVFYFSQTY